MVQKEENLNIVAQKIISDANKKAEALFKQTEEAAEKQFSELKIELEKMHKESVNAATANYKEENKRRLLLCNIDIKRSELAFKQQLLDDVLSMAKQEVLKFSDKKYLELVKEILLKNANDGDKIIVSKKDEKRITAAVVNEVAKKLKIKLTREVESGFEGGVKILGKKFDRDFSLDSILKNIKERCENKLAEILFG